MKEIIVSLYMHLFHWLTPLARSMNMEERLQAHRFLLANLLTLVPVALYALNTIFCIDSDIAIAVALLCAFVHAGTPLVYKYCVSAYVATHLFLFSGFTFQVMHAYYTGGIYSSTIIWLSILPLIAGLTLDKKSLAAWTFIAFITVIIFFFFQDSTLNLMSERGQIWSVLSIAFGYTFLNAILIYIYIKTKELVEQSLSDKTQAIHRLLRIVSHDIGNPLTSLMFRIGVLKKDLKDETAKKMANEIEKSAEFIESILRYTKRFEANEQKKRAYVFKGVHINDIIKNSLFIFKDQLKMNQISFQYDFESNENTVVYADEVALLNQVFNNLFSNAIKFSDDNKKIVVEVDHDESSVDVYFKNSSDGIDDDILENIFHTDIHTATMGNMGVLGNGFGMPILYSTLKTFGAEVEVYNEAKGEEGYTTFKMSFLSSAD